MRKCTFIIIKWYISPFRIEPLVQLFCLGGHVKVSRKVTLLIKHSSEKRNSEFNKTRKGGNNEVPS